MRPVHAQAQMSTAVGAAAASAAAENQRPAIPAHREHITADGSLRIARDAYEQQHHQQHAGLTHPSQRPPGLAAAAPVAPPLENERLEELVDMIVSSRWVRKGTPGLTHCLSTNMLWSEALPAGQQVLGRWTCWLG